ncbi:hypothetical protein MNBD_GAMMA25-1920 [hydrothermal vent metagenome]|uniref:ABC transporter substrate-binding protein n=1 Tax=hydrothermal vent metagenome TaxID=652676 RepID=A0A3B1AXM3_9ZZZZ
MSLLDKIRPLFSGVGLLLFFFVSLALPTVVCANNNINIFVVLSKNTQPYQQFKTQFQQTLYSSPLPKIKFHLIDTDIAASISALYESGVHPDYIVTAGTQAAHQLISTNVSAPTIFSLIPASSYQNNIQHSPYCKTKTHCSAIYLDQPINRQFRLIKKGLPDLRHLGIILGPTSLTMKASILQAAKKYKLDVHIAEAEKDDNLIVLSDKLGKISDALLAIPDPDIYNRKTAKGLLLSSYKNNTPLIAYSKGFVHAGALFSIYSTPEQIAKQTGMMLMRLMSSSENILPASEPPNLYTIDINPAVLRSVRGKINFNDAMLDKR